MSDRQFPVLFHQPTSRADKERFAGIECPRTVPWAMLEPHESQAKSNHDQSLETLASRGGMGPSEIMCVLEHRSCRAPYEPEEKAFPRLVAAVDAWVKTQGKPCANCQRVECPLMKGWRSEEAYQSCLKALKEQLQRSATVCPKDGCMLWRDHEEKHATEAEISAALCAISLVIAP